MTDSTPRAEAMVVWKCPECGHWTGGSYVGDGSDGWRPRCKAKDQGHDRHRPPEMERTEVVPRAKLARERERADGEVMRLSRLAGNNRQLALQALARAEKAEAEAEQMREHADHFGIKRVGELRSDLADAVEGWREEWLQRHHRICEYGNAEQPCARESSHLPCLHPKPALLDRLEGKA